MNQFIELNKTLLYRTGNNKYLYFFLLVFMNLGIIIFGYSLFIYSEIDLNGNFAKWFLFVIYLTLFLNYTLLEYKNEKQIFITLHKIRHYPISSQHMLILFYKIHYRDARLIMYFIVLLSISVGMYIHEFNTTIIFMFGSITAIYLFLVESFFATYFIVKDIHNTNIIKIMSKIILMILWFISIGMNIKKIYPYISLLNAPITFINTLIHNEYYYALSICIGLILLCTLEIHLGYYLIKKYV
jgi:hypothetical protein